MKELLMGNEAIALGAMKAGVGVVAGYPGTPSTEVLETIAGRNPGHIYVEWSVNEKAGLEVAAGAAYAGVRSLVTMKQVGLNVASDPLMSLNYVGIQGGMVVFVADDPGPISSQTEQDTRHFAKYARIPVFDPVSPEEAFTMIGEAFAYSEKYGRPVILRATTRVCHACASIEVGELPVPAGPEGFVKDSSRWVIFPRLSFVNKGKLVEREPVLSRDFSRYRANEIIGSGKIGIACAGVSFSYVMEAIAGAQEQFCIFKAATPYPFPEELAEEFLTRVEQVIVFEELDPVIEEALVYLQGKRGGTIHTVLGKHSGTVPAAGELSAVIIARILEEQFGMDLSMEVPSYEEKPQAPARPPVLCAGCPHRASFYAVKKAMEGQKAVFCGDIGCYTLGNAAPLDMVDTCLCMGAGITVAQGLEHAGAEGVKFAFAGDSTFFASGITGVVNAVYNRADMVLVILDNSTTAMTGHQPHPGTGRTMMGEMTAALSIPKILEAVGVGVIEEADPLDYGKAVETVRRVAGLSGVRAIIFKSPCIAVAGTGSFCRVDAGYCIGCRKCIRELGCPALRMENGKAVIEEALCTGCGLCGQVCPVGCIGREKR